MKVVESPFFRGFVELINSSVALGWHEANGGNLSYRISPEEIELILDSLDYCGWESLDISVPRIAGEFFLITAAGSFFKNIDSDPFSNTGIIQIDDSGTRFRKCWGFANGARPTSELFMHMLNHEVKKLSTGGTNKVIYHSHPANINALTFVVPLTSAAFTRELWTTISECAMIFPNGLGVIDWMLPGSKELAIASAKELKIHDAVIWPHHGMFCAGDSFDEALGLLQTIEKAAEVSVKVRSMTERSLNRITESQIRELNEAYNLGIDPDYISSVFQ